MVPPKCRHEELARLMLGGITGKLYRRNTSKLCFLVLGLELLQMFRGLKMSQETSKLASAWDRRHHIQKVKKKQGGKNAKETRVSVDAEENVMLSCQVVVNVEVWTTETFTN